jgi:hypothetical protein
MAAQRGTLRWSDDSGEARVISAAEWCGCHTIGAALIVAISPAAVGTCTISLDFAVS